MTYPEHAAALWKILVELAEARQTATYAEIGRRLGLNAQNVSGALAPIHAYCEANDLPLLTALVVQTRTGRPGPGYKSPNDHRTDCVKVFSRDWTQGVRPNASELASVAVPGRA